MKVHFYCSTMRSVFYVEEDFVADLLRQYFVGNGNVTHFVKRGTNGHLAGQISNDSLDLFLAQSEDPEKLTKVLETVRRQGRKVPTLVLTSHPDRIPEKYKSFAHVVSTQELLEGNFRWHIRLARTMRQLEQVRARFQDVESVLIL